MELRDGTFNFLLLIFLFLGSDVRWYLLDVRAEKVKKKAKQNRFRGSAEAKPEASRDNSRILINRSRRQIWQPLPDRPLNSLLSCAWTREHDAMLSILHGGIRKVMPCFDFHSLGSSKLTLAAHNTFLRVSKQKKRNSSRPADESETNFSLRLNLHSNEAEWSSNWKLHSLSGRREVEAGARWWKKTCVIKRQ